MYVLGISAFYHDSAAAILKDGVVIAAAEEERFSRTKHDNSFPFRAIEFCLKMEGISIAEVDSIAYYEKPLLKLERILENFVETYPYSIKSFVSTMPEAISSKISVERIIRNDVGFKGPIYFIPHHQSHAALAFYPSPFEHAAVLTIDGVGEYQSTALWVGTKTSLKLFASQDFPHSLGLLYSTITAYLGFRVNDDEYKVMGLSAHGTPRYETEMGKLIECRPDGSFQLNLQYFSFRESSRMWSTELEDLLGKTRSPGSEITQHHKDIAASLQKITEDIYFRILGHLHTLTQSDNICVSGGVALNATANGKIFARTPFKAAYVPGCAGDDGAALGAALFAYHSLAGGNARSSLHSLALGTSYTREDISTEISSRSCIATEYQNDAELVEHTAQLLKQGKVIGWFQGRMEFGPRALGNRSILADPRGARMQDRVNEIKGREEYHPFAGSILEEHADEYFALQGSPDTYRFMTFCAVVRPEMSNSLAAISHADGTCRIQTVPTGTLYYDLIQKFGELTGVPCLLDTSFNRKGEPIVETPAQALDNLSLMAMDYLVIGRFIVEKRHRTV